MLTTSLFCLIFGAFWLIELLLSAAFLQLGARWAGAGRLSFTRSVVTTFLMGVARSATQFAVLYSGGMAPQDQTERIGFAIQLAAVILGLIATWFVARAGLRTSLPKAIFAWMPTLLASAFAFAIGLTVVRPYLFEAYKMPTNAMAPTILGRHLVGTCTLCGGTAYTSASSLPYLSPDGELGICGHCLRTSVIAVGSDRVLSGDRLLVAKFLRPRRWDPIVFQFPEEPSTRYLSRLVGLPGENIEIKDGDIWIDGARAKRPPELSRLVYVAHPAD